MKDTGYSKEDEYFHRKDQELVAKLREKSDAQRAKLEAENQKKEYWMRCPKCGSQMKEEKYGEQVLVDRCSSTGCGGVYFDGGELELLLKAKASLVQKIFGR
jgi:Zn-finger nucleic acid-binding protein